MASNHNCFTSEEIKELLIQNEMNSNNEVESEFTMEKVDSESEDKSVKKSDTKEDTVDDK